MNRKQYDGPEKLTPTTDAGILADSFFERYAERVPAAFAVTRGVDHTLVYANSAFRDLTATTGGAALGAPISNAFVGHDAATLTIVLDRVNRTGIVARDRRLESAAPGAPAWCFTVWPESSDEWQAGRLIIEVREAIEPQGALSIQREVAERMLLSALREGDAARGAEASSGRANFLAAEGRRLAESLDERETLNAMSRMSLPSIAAWCMVDLIDSDGAMHRLAIIHPGPEEQRLLRALEGRWAPEFGDPFGAPAALERASPTIVSAGIDATLAAASHDPLTLRVLHAVGVGSLLTVPLVIRDRVVGAVTFVGGAREGVYTQHDVALAEALVSRSAHALDSARLHGEAISLRRAAESANQAKSAFLGTMSHELRTPLNAIGGFVDLIDMGLRGPVTDEQHADLIRIRKNQQHLMGIVTDLLNFVRIGHGRELYKIADVLICEMVATSVALLEPLIRQKPLSLDAVPGDGTIVARADPDRVTQILLNLLSNAIKFTAAGGHLSLHCQATDDAVHVRLTDTGIGIPPDQFEAIFEPFVQVRSGLAGRDGGVGLGLAISRDLARGMGGDLTAESDVGRGSTFTLTLPRSRTPEASQA